MMMEKDEENSEFYFRTISVSNKRPPKLTQLIPTLRCKAKDVD